MIIFVNDIPLRIRKPDDLPDPGRFTHVVNVSKTPLTANKLIHYVWVQQATEKDLDAIFGFLNSPVPINLFSLDVTVKDYDAVKIYLKLKFKIVTAAGGLVRKKDKFLMIYRLKKWDLPKGKREKDERYRKTAIREIEEECNVHVKIGGKICTTWHTYTMNKNSMLKKTRWYVMDVTDDSKMRPAVEEDIEDIRWMNAKEVYHALEDSYKSINFVFEQYYELVAVNSDDQSL